MNDSGKILTFQGHTAEEALKAAQAALGAKPKVLNVRHVPGKFWGMVKGHYELMVMKDDTPAAGALSGATRSAVAKLPPPMSNKDAVLAVAQEFLQVHAAKQKPAGPQSLVAQAYARSERGNAGHPHPGTDGLGWQHVERKLSQIERFLTELSQKTADRDLAALPEPLRRLHSDLLANDVQRDAARDVVLRVQRRLLEGETPRDSTVRRRLVEVLGEMIPVRGPVQVQDGRRRTVALVGPTGAGKTTTVAKLAGRLALQGSRVGVVSLDTFRIAAPEQLRRQVEIMRIPMETAYDQRGVKAALDQMRDLDVVLVDTTGRNPRDTVEMKRQNQLLRAASPQEVHLVVAANAQPRFVAETMERYGQLSPSNLILTKVDEAPTLGGLLHLVAGAGLGLSYLTVGQQVPDDIEDAVKLGLGYPHGPLAMGDAVGPAKVLAILEAMHAFYREPRYRPSPWLQRRARLGVSLLTAES